MEYPVIDLSSDDRIQLRAANEDEGRELKRSHQRRTVIYWVKDRHGNLLRGIDREGLDRLLGTLRWLDDQDLMRLADEIAAMAAKLKAQTSFALYKFEGRLAYELSTVYEKELYRRVFRYKDVLIAHLLSLEQPSVASAKSPTTTPGRDYGTTK
ncbi:hypothetical protein U8P76_30615 (plasmid) [Rhizobium johnstonii]|nr:hypothetical protein U8P76_30615 [Rhizobium johnstonii]